MADLIDRQAAIDAIWASTSKYTGFLEMEMYTDDDAVEAIENVPSAQPERKKGRWIDDTYCDQCGWTNEVESGFIGSVKGFHFCPNCGADMRGGK